MGLKSGSRDSGLDGSGDEADHTDEQDRTEAEPTDEEPTSSEPSTETGQEASSSATETGSQRPTMDSIPYKLRRDKVNEGREQVPYFLRAEIIDAEAELQDTLEELLGENVYKSDYREAAMVVAQRNPELIAEILREWGYDLDAA